MSDEGLRKFCAALPKIELHAHLNTSFSKVTLQALVDRKIKHDPTFTSNKMTFDGNETAGIEEDVNSFYKNYFLIFVWDNRKPEPETKWYPNRDGVTQR